MGGKSKGSLSVLYLYSFFFLSYICINHVKPHECLQKKHVSTAFILKTMVYTLSYATQSLKIA